MFGGGLVVGSRSLDGLYRQESATSTDAVVQWRKRELANYLSWAEAWPISEYELLPTSIACEFLGSSIFE